MLLFHKKLNFLLSHPKNLSLLLILVAVLLSSLLFTNKAHAVSASNWQAGNIIDDGYFYNNGDMSAWDIADFLNKQMPSCDTNGSKIYSGTTTRAAYGRSRGYPPPYTCLRDLQYNGMSSAQIIKSASDTYFINPKVLIILLQKEQSLITDDWPWPTQYQKATGFACPDTAPCDNQYAGFFNQVTLAARQYKIYKDNPNNYRYKPYQTNNILYNPNSSCGNSPVYISNRATAGLYIYTPYQPNSAALNNMYGTGDGCSAYGNRNFWRMFSDWFGSTNAAPYAAQFKAQSATSGPSTEPLYFGEPRQQFIQYKNVGSSRWYDTTSVPAGQSPVVLAASNPINRRSIFSYGWPSEGRPNKNFSKVFEADGITLAPNQHVVESGQIASFEFNLTPAWSLQAGSYREYFQPVVEGSANWNMGALSWLDFNVASRYQASPVDQTKSVTIQQNNGVSRISMSYKNTGSAAWYDDYSAPVGYSPLKLVTAQPSGRKSIFKIGWHKDDVAANWFSKVTTTNGTLTGNQHVVMPGQIATFEFSIIAPLTARTGLNKEYFRPAMTSDIYRPNLGDVTSVDINVLPSTFSAQFKAQSAYPSSKSGYPSPSFLQYKNTGNVRWYDTASVPTGYSPVSLAASNPINRVSMFSYGWPSGGRPNAHFSKVFEADGTTLSQNQHVVEISQIASFEFNLTPPWSLQSGSYREFFQPVAEGAPNWNMGALSWLDITNRK